LFIYLIVYFYNLYAVKQINASTNLLLLVALFKFSSESSFEEKHKDGNKYKKEKQVCSVSIITPILKNKIGRKSSHN